MNLSHKLELILKRNKFLIYFIIVFFTVDGMAILAGSYFTLYYKSIGITLEQISIIVSASVLITIFSQPFWGGKCDSAKDKKNVLNVLVIACLIFYCSHALNNNFYYILVNSVIFSFFYYSVYPILASLLLEYSVKSKIKFGPVKMFGTLGYCVVSIIFGIIGNINFIFVFYTVLSVICSIFIAKLPKLEGKVRTGKKSGFFEVFKSKKIRFYILSACIINVTLGMYTTFYPIYLTDELSGSLSLYGNIVAITTALEIPYLLFADRIYAKIGVDKTFIISFLLTGARWVLIATVSNPNYHYFVQCLHVFGFIVISFTMMTFINQEVDDDDKASGQTLYVMVLQIFSKIGGSLLGGFLGKYIGLKNVFLICALICFIYLIFFFVVTKSDILVEKDKKQAIE